MRHLELLTDPLVLAQDPWWLSFLPASTAVATAQKVLDGLAAEDLGSHGAVSAVPFSQDDWAQHFGPAWDSMRRAKRRYDPANILTPGYQA
jgi:FAD/FMN-containing dehydrogenase